MRDPDRASRFFKQFISALSFATMKPGAVSSPVKSFWLRVAIGVVAAIIGLASRLAIHDFLGNRLAYLTFYPAVSVVALFGGSVSGVVTAVLCAAVAHIWLFPIEQPGDWIGLSIFLASAVIISSTSEALHHAWGRASHAEARAADKERLQITNERLRLAMRAGAIGAWDFDAAANTTNASPQMREIFGFSSEMLVNPELVFATVIPEDRSGVIEAFRAALDPARDGQYFSEYRIRRMNDNAVRWISSQAQAVFIEGKPTRLIGISRDVTSEKEVEKLLMEKAQLAEQLVSVAASVPGLICSFRRSADGKHSFPYVSAHFKDVYGLTPEEVKGDAEPIFRRIHVDDIDHVAAGIEHSVRTRSLWRDTFRYEHPQKGWIWIEGQSAPVFEPSGAIVWHGYIQDVTARKRAEIDLRESEARLRAFFDSGLLGVIYWNANGMITEANDKFLEMVGYSREDLVAGRIDWIKITPPEFHRCDESALQGIKATGSTQRAFEKEYVCKDGKRLPVLIAGTALDNIGDSGVSFVLDISERKQAEAETQRLYANRTDVMKNMAAGFAHEIKQPLTATGGFVTVARRMLESESPMSLAKVREVLEKAESQVSRAGRIMTRMREFIAHGEPNILRANFHDLIREACAEANAGGLERKVRLEFQLNAETDAVLVDRVQVVLVLVNLIRNAMEAMETGPDKDLTIVTTRDATQIEVDIIDTGAGISPQMWDNLFEPFATTKSSGMGIGLSISRAIIEAHHGRIWASPNPEGGTVFSFTLPLLGMQVEVEKESEPSCETGQLIQGTKAIPQGE
jgi:PAS domain S-box-containing protein